MLMDGRWKRWACAGLIAGAVGCNTSRNQTQTPPGLPTSQGRPSLLSKAFPSKFEPKPPPAEPVVVKSSHKPGEPLKPETEVAFAKAKVEAAFMEGKSAVERDQLLDAARQGYQRALKADPKNKLARLGLAEMYATVGDREHAVAEFQAALKLYPKDHQLAHQMAVAQVRFSDWSGAAESCQYALSLDPENRTYHKTLGYCQAQLGRWDESLASMMKVMPEAKARYFLGRVLIDLKRVDEGRQQIQMAASMDPQFQVAREYLAELNTPRTGKPEPVRQAGFNSERNAQN
jgi:tetratricopeptide (TPR) repeat protein